MLEIPTRRVGIELDRPDLLRGLYRLYRFDELGGAVYSAINAAATTVEGTPPGWTATPRGPGFEFDGSDGIGLEETGELPSDFGDNGFSGAIQFRASTWNQKGGIISLGNVQAAEGWGYLLLEFNNLEYKYRNGSFGDLTLQWSGITNYTAGTVHTAGFTVRADGTVALYWDGYLVAGPTDLGVGPAEPSTGPNPITIGSTWNTTHVKSLTGAITQVAIWRDVLTEGQMAYVTRDLRHAFRPRRPSIVVLSAGGAGGGTEHTVDLAGSITPSGALTKQPRKELAGSLPPAGEVVKQAEKILAGESAASGALSREARKQLAGSTTPVGALTSAAAKVLAGTVTAAGAIANTLVALLDLAGSITPAGALTRQARKQLAGSATPAGALVHEARKAVSGTVTATGAVAKAVARTFTGSITGSGALTARLVALLDLAGSLTPSGALTKRAEKAAAGSVTATGALTRSTSKALAGSLTAVGGLAKRIAKTFTGALTGLAGAVSSVIGGQAEPVIVEATLDGSDLIETALDGSDLVTAELDGP